MSKGTTKYRNLTDAELLSAIDAIRHESPIIAELAEHLEKKKLTDKNTNCRVECPVCEAELTADLDKGNNSYTLEIA